MNNNKKALLLGTTGYIGKYLYNYLKHFFINLYPSSRKLIENYPQFLQLDLLDIDNLKKVISKYEFDYIINATGYVNVTNGQNQIFEDLMRGNTYAVNNLMESIAETNLFNTKIIHFSSMSVYGEANYLPVDEKHSLYPTNLYGVSKLTAEQVINYYANKYGIKSLILRIPGVFGGDRKHGAIYNFVKNALTNEDININTVDLKSWSPIYIDTLGDVLRLILIKYQWNKACRVINVSYGENIDLIKTAFRIKELLDSKTFITVNEPIDYKPFYMSDKNLCDIIQKKYSFEKDLQQYIKTLRENL